MPLFFPLKQMRVGPYQLKNNLIVAPMAGVTDRPFRQLCKRMGAGMAVSEMVASNSLLWGSEKTLRRGNHEGEVEPKVIQIAGADPRMMAAAAQHNVDGGAQIIDGMRNTEELCENWSRKKKRDSSRPTARWSRRSGSMKPGAGMR